MKPFQFFTCDVCGQEKHECEFVETIEEMLCAGCASGLPEEGDEMDGMEDYEDRDYDLDV